MAIRHLTIPNYSSHAEKEELRMESPALNTFKTAEDLTGLDRLDVNERDQLKRLLDRKELFDISIFDHHNDALTEIAAILKSWPTDFTVKRIEILAIVAGEEEEEDLSSLWGDTHNWLPAFLPSLNAWRNISCQIFEIEFYEEHGPKDGDFDELNRLMADVLQAYAPADREIFSNEPHESEAARELLKRYGRYTTCVREMARGVWPEVNLEKLLEQV